MRCGHFDCFSGAAGDMILGALVHAGCPVQALRQTVAQLGLAGVTLAARAVRRGGLAATRVAVRQSRAGAAAHRPLSEILRMIDSAALPARVAQRAAAVFRRLAQAEARVHAAPVEQVRFHELGAVDALVDVVCACAGLERLGLERITCSPIPTGSGTVSCAHGVLPVPAPATVELLRGVPLAACDEPGELTTPTGAAILTTVAEGYGPLPPMRVEAVGYGAGTRAGRRRANVLRLIVGRQQAQAERESDVVSVLEAQCDDATGQALGYACARLLEAGALDAYIVPIIMKKGRPGQLLTVLCQPQDAGALETILFRETTTLGVRQQQVRRSKLRPEHVPVQTRFGTVRVKVGRRGAAVLQAWPEYEDCAALARRARVALREVQQEALRVWARADAP